MRQIKSLFVNRITDHEKLPMKRVWPSFLTKIIGQ